MTVLPDSSALLERLAFARTLPRGAALSAIQNVLKAAREAGLPEVEVRALLERAELHALRGTVIESLECAQEALLLARRYALSGGVHAARLALARALLLLDLPAAAETQVTGALQGAQARGDRDETRQAYVALAQVLSRRGDERAVVAALRTAFELRSSERGEETADLLAELVRAHAELGDAEAVRRFAAAAREAAAPNVSAALDTTLLSAEARIREVAGAAREAADLYEKAFVRARRSGAVATALALQVRLAGLVEPSRAPALLGDALDRARRYGLHEDEGRAHERLAEIYEHLGREREALEHLRAALDIERRLSGERALLRMEGVDVLHRARLAEAERELYRVRQEELSGALADLTEVNARLEALTERDELTGLHNRRFAQAWLSAAHTRAATGDRTFTLALLDIDHFKLVNDTYGHPVGDAVLRELAEVLRSRVPGPHLVARFGGEEFLLAWVNLGRDAALREAQEICRAAEHHGWSALVPGLRLTVTLGLCALEPGLDVASMIRLADDALLLGKRSGRARVIAAQP